MTFLTLPGRGGLITTPLEDVCGLPRGAATTVWPAPGAAGLITRPRIAPLLDLALPPWTPGRGGNMGCQQDTTASHSTTLESNKSVDCNGTRPILTTK